MKLSIAKAADTLLGGGIIAYPTEGVFGLGCMPDEVAALLRLLAIKHRNPGKGFILIAASRQQLVDWIEADTAKIPEPDAAHPRTWVASARPQVSTLLSGNHASLAVRLTSNPTAAAICNAVDSPIVSTSANISGQPVARNRIVLRRRFGACVDYIVPGDCGPASGVSEIRDLVTGEVLRPGSQ